jgi:uncharacterized protein involved in response to NO
MGKTKPSQETYIAVMSVYLLPVVASLIFLSKVILYLLRYLPMLQRPAKNYS